MKNSEITCSRKDLKAERRFSINKGFQCFYIAVILPDSVHRKDGDFLKCF